MGLVHPIERENQKQIERICKHLQTIEDRLERDHKTGNCLLWSIDITDKYLYLAWLQMLIGEKSADYYQNAVEWCCDTPSRSWKE